MNSATSKFYCLKVNFSYIEFQCSEIISFTGAIILIKFNIILLLKGLTESKTFPFEISFIKFSPTNCIILEYSGDR